VRFGKTGDKSGMVRLAEMKASFIIPGGRDVLLEKGIVLEA